LGGNSKTTILVCCSAHIMNRNETIRTLRFAEAAKQVKNKAKINTELGKTAMQNRIKELERQNQELNSKVFELQALLDVVHSKKREVVIQTGQHQHILAGLKEKEQSDGTRVLPHIKSLEVGISSMSLDGDEIGSPEKSKSSDEDEDIAEVLDIIAQSEQSNNIRAGRARGSTVDELMGGPEQFIKARQFQEEQAKADLEQKKYRIRKCQKTGRSLSNGLTKIH